MRALFPLMLVAAAALPAMASAAELVIDGAMARIQVISENRADLQVEVAPGADPMLAVQVLRAGDRVTLRSNLVVRSCQGDSERIDGWRNTRVRFRNGRQAEMSQAPLVTVRAPTNLRISGRGAVSGRVGPARNLSIRYEGCGDWRLEKVSGRLDASASHGSAISAQDVGSGLLRAEHGGAVAAQSVGDLDAQASHGGAISVATARGPARLAATGGGAISVKGGRVSRLDVAAEGGGAILFGGRAGSVNATSTGGAVVSIASADGPVSRSSGGGGLLRIGGRDGR